MATPQTFGEFQDYVKNLEQERGFAGDSVLQKCLLLGEEVGELIILATIANRLDIDLVGRSFRVENEVVVAR